MIVACFMTQICEIYSTSIFGHRIIIDLNGIILLEFPWQDTSKTSKSKEGFLHHYQHSKNYTFLTILHSIGKITEPCGCKIFSLHLFLVTFRLPTLNNNTIKINYSIKTYSRQFNFPYHSKNETKEE